MMTRLLLFIVIAGALSQEVHESKPLNQDSANHIIQKPIPDDVKSWLSPKDSNIATENTPLYILKKKPETSDNETADHVFEDRSDIMKNLTEYIYENLSFAIAPTSDEVETDLQTSIRTTIQNLSNELDRNSTAESPTSQTTTPKPLLPYPTTVYPEILVVIDSTLFKTLGSNIRWAAIYTLALLNGVDLYFRNLESPKFRFNVAAILIIEDNSSIPITEYEPNKIDGRHLIVAVTKLLYNRQDQFPLNSYDIALTLTSRLIGQEDKPSLEMGGISAVGGACNVNDIGHVVQKIATATDTGDFSNIGVIAHEIGHVLGIAGHDGGDNECSTTENFIMTTNTDFNLFKWSQCSLDQLTQTFVNSKAPCLYNKPKRGKPIPPLLPGQLINNHQQCHLNKKNTFALLAENICEHLVCRNQSSSSGFYLRTVWKVAASICSTCGQGKICLFGECVEVK